MESTIEKIKIDNTDIFLEDMGLGKGKITISNTYGNNYSAYWGAMGSDLKSFLCYINEDYFTNNLISPNDNNVMDSKKTFASLRKHIKEECDLPFYKEMEFQKDLREKLNIFQSECEELGDRYFVDTFHSFFNSLDYNLIDCRYDRTSIKDNFNSISEQWHFICNKPSPNYIWLTKLHKKLKKELKN